MDAHQKLGKASLAMLLQYGASSTVHIVPIRYLEPDRLLDGMPQSPSVARGEP